MNIQDFEKDFNQEILKRGKHYYSSGLVLSVDETEPGSYSAKVHGTHLYDVHIAIDEKGTITKSVCTCPYGSKCKHQAAALYYIKYNYNLLNQTEKKEKDEKVRKNSDAIIQTLINEASERAKTKAGGYITPLRLMPDIHFSEYSDSASLSVKIGLEGHRFYSVSDINSLCSSFKYNSYKKYGKELAITHEKQQLDQTSLKFLNALTAYTKNHYYSSYRDVSELVIEIAEIYDGKEILNNTQKCAVHCQNPLTQINIKKAKGGYDLSGHGLPKVVHDSKCLIYFEDRNEMYVTDTNYTMEAYPVLKAVKDKKNIFIAEDNMMAFYSAVLKPLEDYFEFTGLELLSEFTPPPLQAQLYLDSIDGSSVFARMDFNYDGKIYPAFADKTEVNPFCDYIGEAEAKALVLRYFTLGCSDTRYSMSAEGDEEIYDLLTEGMTEFAEKMEVFATESFRRITVRPPANVVVGIRPEGSLLELDISSENYNMQELLDCLKSYRTGRKFHRLRDGSFAVLTEQGLDELNEITEALNIKDKDFLKGVLTVPQYRMFYLNSLQKDYGGLRIRRSREFKAAAEKYGTVEERVSETIFPAEIDDIMREYQKYGFLWMKTISEYGFGGILADDMGLGKTLQAIALILNEKEELKENFKTAFVVCPSSLTLNWISEVKKFAPSLKAEAASGTAAERKAVINRASENDIIITSYTSLTHDIEKYENIEFGLCFIDEAQYIKNHSTQAAKAVKAVKSRTRFALTGTPIENSLAELWSIFDFIMPDYLFGYNHFKGTYEIPIVKNSDKKTVNALQKMTAPFILRRMKKDVLTELPDKTETLLTAEMTNEQRKLYTANLLSLKDALGENSDFNTEGTRFKVLAMITKLRQICCDPSLVYEDYKGGSGKLELCAGLVENSVNAGHKVLLFSQFTSMLDILRDTLTKMGISYFILTGKTNQKERLNLVNRFNKDSTQVFLISLKAGGTGLNLTGADIVIHYDAWWNVSAENQASDRAYRIGQKNNVQIYKLVAENSIEEKIQELQKSKQQLAELALSSDADIMKMSAADIMKLLE